MTIAVAEPAAETPVLSAESVAVRPGRDDRDAAPLRDVTVHVRRGETFLLQGPSGSGKTLLLMALARLIPLAAGRLLLHGEPAGRIPPPQWRARVGLVTARPVVVAGTLRDNLLLPWQFAGHHGRPVPADDDLRGGLDALGLGEVGLHQDATALSTGQTARVALLRHLLAAPEVLLLDEPTAHLDRASAERVWQALERHRARTGAALLVASHQPPGLSGARALRLAGGRLLSGEAAP